MNAARMALMVGAAGSVAIMLHVGHRNTGWVLSPFVALLLAARIGKRLQALAPTTLHRLMLILTLGSLAMYGYVALRAPRPKPAAVFLLVPLGSWILVGAVFAIAAFQSSRQPGGRGQVPN